MKLNEMANALEERYVANQQQKESEEETLRKEAQSGLHLITDIIASIKSAIEQNFNVVYQAYEDAQPTKKYEGKNRNTTIICYIPEEFPEEHSEDTLRFKVMYAGYTSRLFYLPFDTRIIRQFDDHFEKYYTVEGTDEAKEEILQNLLFGGSYSEYIGDIIYFSLDENSIRFKKIFSGVCPIFARDAKKFFTNASVRCMYEGKEVNIKFKY